MAKYSDFKSYIKANYGDYLKQELLHFVDANHDGQGFHSINVLSLCKQDVANLNIKSLKCNDLPGPFVKIDVNLTADIVTLGLGTRKYEADRKTRWFTVHLKANLRDGMELLKAETSTEEYRGLAQWSSERGYLTDTCLAAQDKFKKYLDYFRIAYEK